jgi:hypothetical protein
MLTVKRSRHQVVEAHQVVGVVGVVGHRLYHVITVVAETKQETYV